MITQAQGASVEVVDTNTNTTIDLTDIVGSVSPQLADQPILDLIRNTSVNPAESMTAQAVYFGATYGERKQFIGEDGLIKNDPRTTTAGKVKMEVKRHSAQSNFDKVGMLGWDLNTARGQQGFATTIAGWVTQNRIAKSEEVFEEALAEVKKVAITGKPTTFATGGHLQTKAIATPDEAYDIFVEATTNFQLIGRKKAKGAENKVYNRAKGIKALDMIVLMTPAFKAKLLAKDGVFASTSGFEAFKNGNIASILGYPTATTNDLPEDCNFMIVTTGTNGALGVQNIGDGVQVKVITDPDWAFGRRADMVDNHTKGVVYKFLIFVQMEK